MVPIKIPSNHCTESKRSDHKKFLTVGLICLGLLVAEGAANRWLNQMVDGPDSRAVKLEKPLSTLPLRIGTWKGEDIPLTQRVIEVAGCDDYVNRRYTDEATGRSVILYLAYAARPARMIGHRPQVCYPAQGWQSAGERVDHVTLSGNKTLECRIHHFKKSNPERQAVVVLNYYILQGRYTTDWTDFWGVKWRMPNLMKDTSFYVLQAQISGGISDFSLAGQIEGVIKEFTAELEPHVQVLIPVSSGKR